MRWLERVLGKEDDGNVKKKRIQNLLLKVEERENGRRGQGESRWNVESWGKFEGANIKQNEESEENLIRLIGHLRLTENKSNHGIIIIDDKSLPQLPLH